MGSPEKTFLFGNHRNYILVSPKEISKEVLHDILIISQVTGNTVSVYEKY